MIDLFLSWLTGAGILLTVLVGLIILGFVARLIVPIDKWNDPFKYPSWELTADEIMASLAAGFVTGAVIIIPLVIGASILA